MSFSRRNFFKLAGASAVGASMVSPLEALYARSANGQFKRGTGYGALTSKLPENADELDGLVYQGVDLGRSPALALPPVPLVAMGRFNHEAIAVDPDTVFKYPISWNYLCDLG
jgi:secreted PhoX family phosphatase